MRTGSAILAILLLLTLPALAEPAQHRFFTTSDGVRLHYLEAGRGHTIVLVPGWTMPAWIFDRQIADFSRRYHVIAFDPRGQGDSEAPASGYEPGRRGQDIGELIPHVAREPVLVIGWSLGVLDALAYIHASGEAAIAGLVLVDNSVGEEPAPVPSPRPARPAPRLSREATMRGFVRSMFARPQPQAYLDLLAETALRTPPAAAAALMAYPVPRTYWRDALYDTHRPVLYLVRPGFAGQAENLAAHHPTAEAQVLTGVGHALFVDDPARFAAITEDFIRRRVWR